MLNENMECTCKCECKPANNCALQGELLQKIRCYAFAVNDIALYLDTHPTDSKALCLHRKYCQELKDLEDKYQRVYGPLTINYPCNKWRWLEEPWRSFILGFFICFLFYFELCINIILYLFITNYHAYSIFIIF